MGRKIQIRLLRKAKESDFGSIQLGSPAKVLVLDLLLKEKVYLLTSQVLMTIYLLACQDPDKGGESDKSWLSPRSLSGKSYTQEL